jgi:hypothetical protein
MGSIAESAPALKAAGFIGVWSTNVVAGRTILDAGAAALLAGNPDLVGHPIPMEIALGATHPADRAWLFERILRVRQTGGPFSAEFRIVTAAGDVRWILNRGLLAPDESGKLTGLGAYIDTTDSHASPFISAASLTERLDDPLEAAADRCLQAHRHLKRGGFTDLRRVAEVLLTGIGRALAERKM